MFRCVAAIPNAGGNCVEHFYEDTQEGRVSADAFVRQYNRDGWGVYDCVSPLTEPKRTKATVAKIFGLHFDIDARQVKETKEQIIERLRIALLPFGILTRLNDSGRGVHGYCLFKEPIEAGTVGAERADRLLKRLVAQLGADRAPTHFAALMRRAGTVNSKDGGGPCEMILDTGTRCELSDIEAYLDLVDGNGELFASADEGASHDRSEVPVDTDADLTAMEFGNTDGRGVNATVCRVIPSLIWKGWHPDDIAAAVVDAAMQMAERCGLEWDRAAEEALTNKRILSAYHNLFEKDYDPSTGVIPVWLHGEFQDEWARILEEGRRPTVSRNGAGWFPKRVREAGEAPSASKNVLRLVSSQEEPKDEARQERQYRFRLIPFNEMPPGAEPLYLVDELIPAAGLVDLWGKPKCFKSFWALDLMFHVATGREYRDRYVQQGAVVYCAFEGAHGYKKRMEAIRRHYNIEEEEHVPLYVMPGQASLVKDHGLIIREIKAQLGNTNVAAFVLDTLNRSLDGSESKDVDMTAYVRAAEAIRDAFKCVVVIVHHCGLDETRPRGHTSLPAAVDAQLAVTREGSIVTVTVEMMRDGPEETSIVSAVESIEVGTDATGAPLTSLVVKPTEAPAGSSPPRRWTKSLTLFRDALCDALNDTNDKLTVGNHTVRVVDRETVRTLFYARCVADGSPDEAQDTRKKRFFRAVERAQELKLIGVKVEPTGRTLLWLATPEEACHAE
jgi:AAA domain